MMNMDKTVTEDFKEPSYKCHNKEYYDSGWTGGQIYLGSEINWRQKISEKKSERILITSKYYRTIKGILWNREIS
jgi:hypothetical protein